MTFQGLTDGVDAECIYSVISKYTENIEDAFCKRVDKNLSAREFRSFWKMGKKPPIIEPTEDNCEDILSIKGVSISKFNDQTRDYIIQLYRSVCSHAPQLKHKYYCSFKFKSGAGKVRCSPTNDDPWHHDFYKSDAFSINFVEIIEREKVLNHVSD
jgi:hypothetical protein